MKAYSVDLREKVVLAYQTGNFSVRKLAATFGVGKAFVQKMLKQYREEGHVNPGKQGTRKKAVLADYSVQLIALVEKYPDATLSEYCEYWLVPQLWEGAVVLMDNLFAHKIDEITPIIEAVGARVINLSPYSPDFNPIEHWWSQLKAFIKTFSPKTTQMVDALIAVALNLINPTHLRNWFANCCYCTS
jgi:transposase/transposase-like protein